jgi:nicotinate-nucleotide pyrophosphorylase (carboxylating)
MARSLGLAVIRMLKEGQTVRAGDEVARFSGNPKQIAMAEDVLIGLISKPSGVATAARKCADMAGEGIQIVCGSWKKMPVVLKETLRKAIVAGGVRCRISREPFVYLDKNYIRMLGGIGESLRAVAHLKGYKKVVQIKGLQDSIENEAAEAAGSGADILYIDNGKPEDVKKVAGTLDQKGARDRVKIAFGGNVTIEDIDRIRTLPLDIVEIGKQIIDAPLLDLRLEVVEVKE